MESQEDSVDHVTFTESPKRQRIKGAPPGISASTNLGVPVVGLFELQVLPGLAAQVQPLSFQPLHGGLPHQVAGVHLGHKGHVLSWQKPEE